MAFVFTATAGPQVRTHIGSGEEEHVAMVPLGHDDETGCVYTLFVSLGKTPGAAHGERELMFWLNEYDPEFDGNYLYWDGKDTSAKITSPEHREHILAIIQAMVARLVEILNPKTIVIQTCIPHLPNKACSKYLIILQKLFACGYHSVELEPYHGNRMWVSERFDPANN